jgi:TonB family protein
MLLGRRIAGLLGSIAVTSTLCLASGDLDQQLQANLSHTLEGRETTLKAFYTGHTLKFDEAGHLVHPGNVGPWTLYSKIVVSAVTFHDHSLRIEANRIAARFDHGTPVYLKTDDQVELSIPLNGTASDNETVRQALATIFLAPTERLSDFVPSYWQESVRALETSSNAIVSTSESIFSKRTRVKPAFFHPNQGITPPEPIKAPYPEYPEKNRLNRIEGTTVLGIIVDESGMVHDPEVLSPVGLGFDDEAVRTVQNWKFRPATKNGARISVRFRVEVNFRLRR